MTDENPTANQILPTTLYLPHPGVSDEFWALVPEKDREGYSAFLVAEQGEPEPPIDKIPEEIVPNIHEIRTEEVRKIAEAFDVPEEILTASASSGGWCAPSDQIYSLLPVLDFGVKRGGMSFTAPKPLTEWTKKELRAEVERLRRQNDTLAGGSATLRTEARRLRRKNKRLLKIIEKMA